MEIIKTYESMDDYMEHLRQQKIDEVYKEAITDAIDKKSNEELTAEYCSTICDLECELSIAEDLLVKGKIDKNEVIQLKKKLTKTKNEFDNLIKEE